MDTPVVMLGVSAALRGIEDEIEHAVGVHSPILLTGEDGVGKTLVGHLIHQRSPRAAGPLVMASCADVPEPALESHLFGPVADAGNARDDTQGRLAAADGGTIFIDDVGEMSLRVQAMFLRFLETGELPRVGPDRRPDRRGRRLDVRVMTATPRSLFESVVDRTFREDLYYRLNIVHITIPSLRERREDVPVLLHHFLRVFADAYQRPVPTLTGDALTRLIAYRWPGNVRELKAVAERLVMQAHGQIDAETLPSEIKRGARKPERAGTPAPPPARPVHELVFARILQGSDTFWSGVYKPFMARDLTRTDVRAIVRLGLACSGGQFRMFGDCFRVAPRDYKRFVAFLRKCQCDMPRSPVKVAPAGLRQRSIRSRRATA